LAGVNVFQAKTVKINIVAYLVLFFFGYLTKKHYLCTNLKE